VSDTLSVFDDNWDELDDWSGGGAKSKGLVKRGPQLGATVYELGPGNSVVYHFHHGSEELLVVLSGRPTLRTPEGERQLKEGEVVHFPRGPEGAHQLSNRSEAVVRYVVAASQGSPEIIEYPDSGKIAAMARTETSAGGPLFTINRLDDAVDYFEGESGT